MKSVLKTLGENIKNLRIESGLSQETLSSLVGVERSQLSKIEKGLVNGVTFLTIAKIYEGLGLKLEPVNFENNEFDVHPFVKWAGGKTQLLDVIAQHMPAKFNRYFEPFVGGGALLFKILPDTFSINDFNNELVCAYKCLQDTDLYIKLKKELIKHEENHSEEYYFKVREMDRLKGFDKLPVYVHAARMIYLNKACFNGLYRVNRNGYFNVPSGKKEKVNCFDRDNLDELYRFFKSRKCSVTNVDFEEAVKNAKAGDFVYFDPPYDTWEDKGSFTSYDKNEFGKEEQKRLRDVFKSLADRGVYVMLSNHNTKYINELYQGFHINVVNAKRMINSNANGRGFVEEVLITNYE